MKIIKMNQKFNNMSRNLRKHKIYVRNSKI